MKAITNHVAQCTAASSKALESLLAQVFGPVLRYIAELTDALDGASGPNYDSVLVGDYITFAESDHPVWTASNQRAVQANTLIQEPDSDLESRDAARAALTPFLYKCDAEQKFATGIQANFYTINGSWIQMQFSPQQNRESTPWDIRIIFNLAHFHLPLDSFTTSRSKTDIPSNSLPFHMPATP